MEGRAPGGELLLRPLEWLKLLSYDSPPPPGWLARVASVPDRPMTRLEYLEEMAFAKEKEK